MTTLTSKNQEKTLDLPMARAVMLVERVGRRCYGDMLIMSTQAEIKIAISWLIENGVSNIYFNPADEPLMYSDFIFATIAEADESSAIRLYN